MHNNSLGIQIASKKVLRDVLRSLSTFLEGIWIPTSRDYFFLQNEVRTCRHSQWRLLPLPQKSTRSFPSHLSKRFSTADSTGKGVAKKAPLAILCCKKAWHYNLPMFLSIQQSHLSHNANQLFFLKKNEALSCTCPDLVANLPSPPAKTKTRYGKLDDVWYLLPTGWNK